MFILGLLPNPAMDASQSSFLPARFFLIRPRIIKTKPEINTPTSNPATARINPNCTFLITKPATKPMIANGAVIASCSRLRLVSKSGTIPTFSALRAGLAKINPELSRWYANPGSAELEPEQRDALHAQLLARDDARERPASHGTCCKIPGGA